MERKIEWVSGCYDEIELVYDKADENEQIAKILSELEEMALAEGRANCANVRYEGETLTPEKYDTLPEHDREGVLCVLGQAGLSEFKCTPTDPVITVTLSPIAPFVLGCTMFSILNRLEKLDGAFNAFFPKATLKLQVPLGGK